MQTGRTAKLKALWAELNSSHFGGALASVPIRITRSRRTYGYFNAPNNGGQPSIRISVILADTEPLVRDTMLHEMIHQQLHADGWPEWDQHGLRFQTQHERIFGQCYIEP